MINLIMKPSIVFLEATSCVGKTTLSDVSFDYDIYTKKYPFFQNKHEKVYLQTIYNDMLFKDVTDFLKAKQESNEQMDLCVDRCGLSSLVYDILFHFKGHVSEPSEFEHNVQKHLLSDQQVCAIIKANWINSFREMKQAAPSFDVQIVWVIPSNVEKVEQQLRNRNTFEVGSFNLLNYIRNQNFLFTQLAQLTQVGILMHVESYVTKEDLKNKCQFRFS